jgi:glutamate-1-semialdehyde 2,1-aminomutase
VYQAGTLSGNPLATAAGLAALEHLTPEVYDVLAARSARLAAGLDAALAGVGLGRARAYRTLFGGVFGTDPSGGAVPFPHDYDEARRTDEAAYARFFHALLDRGVAMAPGAYEVGFCGLAHTDDVVDDVIGIATEAAQAAAG